MKCEKCIFYNSEDDVCKAFPQCSGQDCNDLLPCEEQRLERRRATVRASQRRRRARAVAQGLCMVCAIRPARPGMKTCEYCCQQITNANRRRLDSLANTGEQ